MGSIRDHIAGQFRFALALHPGPAETTDLDSAFRTITFWALKRTKPTGRMAVRNPAPTFWNQRSKADLRTKLKWDPDHLLGFKQLNYLKSKFNNSTGIEESDLSHHHPPISTFFFIYLITVQFHIYVHEFIHPIIYLWVKYISF